MIQTKKLRYWMFILGLSFFQGITAHQLRILNFQVNTGFKHNSLETAKQALENLAKENNWKLTSVSTSNQDIEFSAYDVVVFNNNSGVDDALLNEKQQTDFMTFIQKEGGFVGIHCGGAIRDEGESFQHWFDGLIGTKLVDHPKAQPAKVIVEDRNHPATSHFNRVWQVVDEYHTYSKNPREDVNVLLALEESIYEGILKMGGDYPAARYQYYDGGRSFFTTLGHPEDIYKNNDFIELIEGGLIWASKKEKSSNKLPVSENLILDLNADQGLELEDVNKVASWTNQADYKPAISFVKRDKGRKQYGSGRPELKLRVPELNYHNTISFRQQELVNHNEDAFDHLITGSGFTWVSVMAAYEQKALLKDVNSFFGNLRNDGKFEGIWGGFTDDNKPWAGSRNGLTFGRWDENNPYVLDTDAVKVGNYYILVGRMQAGKEMEVPLELFVNGQLKAKKLYPVTANANASKMVIGQERDAINHPGFESFRGEIGRFLIYDRPLSNNELNRIISFLQHYYHVDFQ